MTTANQYEVTLNGKEIKGPATVEVLRKSIDRRKLSKKAFARIVGTHDWIPVLDVVGNECLTPSPIKETILVAEIVESPPQVDPRILVLDRQCREFESRLHLLRAEYESIEEKMEMQSFGFYRPRYSFESAEQYEKELDRIRREQKVSVKSETAAMCAIEWVVEGSKDKGKKMMREQVKLMLRAFNGECDAAIAKVKYDNVSTLAKRVDKSFADLNKLGATKQIAISPLYLALKHAELSLVHEHREKQQQEKEVQKRLREMIREENKEAERLERAKEEAEKEEAVKSKALERARAELAETHGKQHEKLEFLVSRLENELKEALDRKAKAIARAQLTKSGHVYILSNVGTFGPDVYKIGLTRRLDPHERVWELGDASVPFPFDIHAVIYSENAPALEAELHREFAHRRINFVNHRKEFFRVTLAEIREIVDKVHGIVTFVLHPEAEEYRKSCAICDERIKSSTNGEEMEIDE